MNRLLRILITSFLWIGFIGCFDQPKKINKNTDTQPVSKLKPKPDSDCFDSFARQFTPTSISLDESINDSFSDCIMAISDYNDIKIRKGVYLVLLKHYLIQLHEAHMGYQLITHKNNPGQKIVNIYIKINNFDSAELYDQSLCGQGLYSHAVYTDALKNKEMLKFPEIKEMVRKISKEKKRVEKIVNDMIEEYEKP